MKKEQGENVKDKSSDEKGKHSNMAMRGVARPQMKMDGDKKDDSEKGKDKKSGDGEMSEMRVLSTKKNKGS